MATRAPKWRGYAILSALSSETSAVTAQSEDYPDYPYPPSFAVSESQSGTEIPGAI